MRNCVQFTSVHRSHAFTCVHREGGPARARARARARGLAGHRLALDALRRLVRQAQAHQQPARRKRTRAHSLLSPACPFPHIPFILVAQPSPSNCEPASP